MFGTAAKRRIKRSDMNSIATQYLGLELSGPVIMGSSGLTSTLRHIVEARRGRSGRRRAQVRFRRADSARGFPAGPLQRLSGSRRLRAPVRVGACARAVSRSDSRGAGPLRDTRDRQYPLRSSGRMGLLCTVDRAGRGFGNRAEHIRPAYGCRAFPRSR